MRLPQPPGHLRAWVGISLVTFTWDHIWSGLLHIPTILISNCPLLSSHRTYNLPYYHLGWVAQQCVEPRALAHKHKQHKSQMDIED